MTVSLIIGIVVVAIVLFFIVRAARKHGRRLDNLHITTDKK